MGQALSLTSNEKLCVPISAGPGVQQNVARGKGEPELVNVAPCTPPFHCMVTFCPALPSLEVISKHSGKPAQTLMS